MSSSGGGIRFTGLLLILFVALFVLDIGKLTGVINWSWLWVLRPLWSVFAFVGCFMLIGLLISFISAVCDRLRAKRRARAGGRRK